MGGFSGLAGLMRLHAVCAAAERICCPVYMVRNFMKCAPRMRLAPRRREMRHNSPLMSMDQAHPNSTSPSPGLNRRRFPPPVHVQPARAKPTRDGVSATEWSLVEFLTLFLHGSCDMILPIRFGSVHGGPLREMNVVEVKV